MAATPRTILWFFFIFVSLRSGTGRDNCKMVRDHQELKCANITSHFMPTELFLTFDDDVHGFSSQMISLEVQHSNISILQNQTFKYAPLLRHIILSNISLTEIDRSAFQGLRQLKWVDLSFNDLRHIPADTFKYTTLNMLDLEGNARLEIPTDGPIFEAKKLTWLKLSNCNIQHLPWFAFSPNTGLFHLDLSRNLLEALPQQIFAPLQHLTYLDLSGNKFQTLDFAVFQTVPSFPEYPKIVRLFDNPWSCDCVISRLVWWSVENKDGKWSEIAEASRLRKPVFCRGPKSLAGVSWNNLRQNLVAC